MAKKLTFDDGVLWAAARLVESFDEPTLARELLVESGVDTKRADIVDAPLIKKALESEREADEAGGK